VASEVRSLAERSHEAATDITDLARHSVEVALQADNMLTTLVPHIQQTAELVREISAASAEQDAGALQIQRAIQQLDSVIQQNSSTSEEMSSMSEELAAQAEQLQQAIGWFKVQADEETRGTAFKTRLLLPGVAQRKPIDFRANHNNGRNGHETRSSRSFEPGTDDLDREFERY
jgi:methyl-accepting chemotaxis protein